MKGLKGLLTIAFVMLVSGIYASAQTVSIKNDSGQERKICFYNIDDKIGIVPKICFTMKKNEGALWENKDKKDFMVKIFKPGIFDEYLYTRRLPEDTKRIIVGEGGRFGFGRYKPKPEPKRYFLKVCNQQYEQTVYFSLGFEVSKGIFTEGWWSVEKGKCSEFPVSERLKKILSVEYGTLPRTFYYAKIYGDNPLEWRGGENDYNLCINDKKAFRTFLEMNSTGQYQSLPCAGDGQKFVRFRRLEDPKANQEYYFLTF